MPRAAYNAKVLFIAFLLGVSLFSAFKYAVSFSEKRTLLERHTQGQAQIVSLETEKQRLLASLGETKQVNAQLMERNVLLKDNLSASHKKVDQIALILGQAQKAGEELGSRLAILKAENSALRKEAEELKEDVGVASQENDTLKAKLSSIQELKKALRQLKTQARTVVKTLKEKVKMHTTNAGNRGFLFKDGRPTYAVPAVKIEVLPVAEKP